jgi:transposase
MKYGGGMNELPYPSDLTAAQWALIEPLLPAPKPKGRKRRVDLRKITKCHPLCAQRRHQLAHVAA